MLAGLEHYYCDTDSIVTDSIGDTLRPVCNRKLPNGITNFTYNKCNGLKIIGYNAKIDLKGDFRQTADVEIEGLWYSYSETVVPFYMRECTNFSIEGFEIDGNVDQMTCDPATIPTATASFGIAASTCKDYNISNIFAHHFATDGVVLGYAQSPDKTHTEKVLADRNAYLYNVRSSNNHQTTLDKDVQLIN
jgi:hypothetical protein